MSDLYWPDGKTMEDKSMLDIWQKYLAANLTAPFAVSQACIPYMWVKSDEVKEKLPGNGARPCIIRVGGFRSMVSDPNQERYASTEAGLFGLTHSMSISMASSGISVNLIALSKIDVQRVRTKMGTSRVMNGQL